MQPNFIVLALLYGELYARPSNQLCTEASKLKSGVLTKTATMRLVILKRVCIVCPNVNYPSYATERFIQPSLKHLWRFANHLLRELTVPGLLQALGAASRPGIIASWSGLRASILSANGFVSCEMSSSLRVVFWASISMACWMFVGRYPFGLFRVSSTRPRECKCTKSR